MFGFTRMQSLFLLMMAGVVVASILGGVWLTGQFTSSTSSAGRPSAEKVAAETDRMLAFNQQLACAGATATTTTRECSDSIVRLGGIARGTTQSWPADDRFSALRDAYATEWERFGAVTKATLDANADGAIAVDEREQLRKLGVEWKQSQIASLERKHDIGMLTDGEHRQALEQAQGEIDRLNA